MDCSLPGSSVHGIFQARILEKFAISFTREERIFLTQELNSRLLHLLPWQADSLPLHHLGSKNKHRELLSKGSGLLGRSYLNLAFPFMNKVISNFLCTLGYSPLFNQTIIPPRPRVVKIRVIDLQDFPGSPEVRTLHSHCRILGSIPGCGTKIS